MNSSLMNDPNVQAHLRAIAARNATANADFDGLTPAQMHDLYYFPFDERQSPIRWQTIDNAVAETVPLRMSLVTALHFFAGEKGEKLTPQGRWPRKLLLAIDALANWSGESFRFGPPRLEEDLPPASMLHAICIGEGWLRKANGRLSLTKKGKAVLAMTAAEQLAALWQASALRFSWAFLDGYPELPDLQNGWSFLVWLLLKHGADEKPVSFYAQALCRAWPHLLTDLPPSTYFTPERQLQNMLTVRAFQRWLWWFGCIEMRHETGALERGAFVRATPLLHTIWGGDRLHL